MARACEIGELSCWVKALSTFVCFLALFEHKARSATVYSQVWLERDLLLTSSPPSFCFLSAVLPWQHPVLRGRGRLGSGVGQSLGKFRGGGRCRGGSCEGGGRGNGGGHGDTQGWQEVDVLAVLAQQTIDRHKLVSSLPGTCELGVEIVSRVSCSHPEAL